jgi:hypothetical protein
MIIHKNAARSTGHGASIRFRVARQQKTDTEVGVAKGNEVQEEQRDHSQDSMGSERERIKIEPRRQGRKRPKGKFGGRTEKPDR